MYSEFLGRHTESRSVPRLAVGLASGFWGGLTREAAALFVGRQAGVGTRGHVRPVGGLGGTTR